MKCPDGNAQPGPSDRKVTGQLRIVEVFVLEGVIRRKAREASVARRWQRHLGSGPIAMFGNVLGFGSG